MLLYRYCFDLLCKDNFQVQTTGGLYSEGRFNGGFFALRVWGAYIWRGLYLEGLAYFRNFTVLCNMRMLHNTVKFRK